MSADALPEGGRTPPDGHKRRTVDKLVIASSAGGAVLVDVTLMRYAIDLVAPLCLFAVLPRSIRDGVADWVSGQRYERGLDPIWAVSVTAVHLIAAAVSLTWILSTSSWMRDSRLEGWIPTTLSDVASVGEAYGWGRRAILPGSGRQLPVWTIVFKVGPHDESTPRGTNLLAPAIERAPVGTSGRAKPVAVTSEAVTSEPVRKSTETPPPAASPPGKPVDTAVALVTSHPVLRAGSAIQLTATVTASRQRPTGRVLFRRDTVILKSVQLNSEGRAGLRLQSLPPGAHTISAEFTGSASFRRSHSKPVILRVTP